MTQINTLQDAEARVNEVLTFIGTPRTRRESRIASMLNSINADIPDAPIVIPPPTTPPPTVPPPTIPDLTQWVPFTTSQEEVMLEGVLINAPNGVHDGTGIELHPGVKRFTLNGSVINSFNYGVWLNDCDKAVFVGNHIIAKGGGNAYCIRGNPKVLQSQYNTFYADHSWRIYACQGGFSINDTYDVGQLRVGGGTSSEWAADMPEFGGPDANNPFIFGNGFIKARQQVTIYNKTRNVTFSQCDFAGTGKIFIDFGAHDIVFTGCKNLPAFRYHDAAGNQYFPTAAQLADRRITILP